MLLVPGIYPVTATGLFTRHAIGQATNTTTNGRGLLGCWGLTTSTRFLDTPPSKSKSKPQQLGGFWSRAARRYEREGHRINYIPETLLVMTMTTS